LVLQLANLYAEHDLIIDGAAPPLWSCCANRQMCWRSAQDARPNASCAGISLPWIGPDYKPGGVLILGMNFNDYGGLAAAWKLADWERRAF
jgi:hypothetical protein